MENATDQLQDGTDGPDWQFAGFHDRRRTWATQLQSADVDAMVVCDWDGWNDLDTSLDHYRGTHAPKPQRRETVDWLYPLIRWLKWAVASNTPCAYHNIDAPAVRPHCP
jgi:hypothetical protein